MNSKASCQQSGQRWKVGSLRIPVLGRVSFHFYIFLVVGGGVGGVGVVGGGCLVETFAYLCRDDKDGRWW